MMFFLDESGINESHAPCEVLCGVAVHEATLWNLVERIHHLELEHFGTTLSAVDVEYKGKVLLKNKRFDLAAQKGPIEKNRRRDLARTLLTESHAQKLNGITRPPKGDELTAYSQAVLAFVTRLLKECQRFNLKAFGAIVARGAPKPLTSRFLRKDYRYLFERFSKHVESQEDDQQGVLVFDESETRQSQRLLNEIRDYCRETMAGHRLTGRIIPLPFFVHSHLTPVIQVADICAYIISWGVRVGRMKEPAREELAPLARLVRALEWKQESPGEIKPWVDYGLFYLESLKDRRDREEADAGEDEPDLQVQKKEEEETESPPPLRRQSDRSPMPPGQLSLPGFDPSNSNQPKKIRRSHRFDH
ncbi:DUF3800 domain-containing protein [Luteolibacter soli]|uniref:DUF3800 domain-containing protein n=1 Tax=Luteolibacter soli TaxID=3135280 RepID=A0ABU9ASD5_9BACT